MIASFFVGVRDIMSSESPSTKNAAEWSSVRRVITFVDHFFLIGLINICKHFLCLEHVSLMHTSYDATSQWTNI